MDSSLNLNTLASSLPNAYQNAEKDLLNNFKAAALSITTLYRSSRNASKRAFNAGYASACNDILLMIQQGVSAEGIEQNPRPSSNPNSSFSASLSDAERRGMTIGKVMDWIEARMEAIRSREEEEDEEEEKEKERERGNPTATGSKAPKAAKSNREHVGATQSSQAQSGSQPASPSPPPTTLRQTQRSHHKSSRTQAQSKVESPMLSSPQIPSVDASNLPNSTPFNFVPGDRANIPSVPSSSPPLSVSTVSPFSSLPDNVSVAAGAKRRHAVMMMLDPSSSAPSSGGSSTSTPNGSPASIHHNAGSRRRTRSSRTNIQNLGLNLGLASEAMDVEEDGRERKRVARR